MILTASSNTTICIVIALLSWFNLFTIIPLLIASIAFGCVTSAQAPMRLATVPRLVNREQLANAIGITAILFNTSRIIGPAITAALLTVVESKYLFIFAGLLFLTTAILLTTVKLKDSSGKKGDKSIMRDLLDGLKFVITHTPVKLVFLLTLINGLVVRTLMELLPAVSGELTNGTAEELATLTACAGAGSILGGFVVSRQNGRVERLIRLVFIALTVSQILLLPLLWLKGLWGLIPIFTMTSMMMTVAGTSSQALLQLTVDQEYVGRVMGLWMVIALGSPAIGAFIIGALADWYGIQIVIFSFAMFALLLTSKLVGYRHRLFLGE